MTGDDELTWAPDGGTLLFDSQFLTLVVILFLATGISTFTFDLRTIVPAYTLCALVGLWLLRRERRAAAELRLSPAGLTVRRFSGRTQTYPPGSITRVHIVRKAFVDDSDRERPVHTALKLVVAGRTVQTRFSSRPLPEAWRRALTGNGIRITEEQRVEIDPGDDFGD
ncbi:hypothetical protein [Dactylosporangium sp. CA-092794]|uniref:hypothetical protein n=1 Tax=Dactylosporangium sp. CA-092794 TaxID=3239929 RepID=UPI003D92390E